MSAKKPTSHLQLFSIAFVAGMTVILMMAAYNKWQMRPLYYKAYQLDRDIWVTKQVTSPAISKIRSDGFKSIIDLRPDGEADDQPSSDSVKQLAQQEDLHFSYVPVPHGDIPTNSVTALEQALTASPKPVLLYCRSGSRAARTWSLVEASRTNGFSAEAILKIVKAAGHNADDLAPQINQRVTARAATSVAGENKQ